MQLFAEYESETLARVWWSLFERYGHVLRARGDDEFEIEHTETARRQKRGELATTVNIGREVYKAALDWWVNSRNENEKEYV